MESFNRPLSIMAIIITIFVMCVFTSLPATAAPVKLTAGSWGPPKDMHAAGLQLFKSELEKQSQGNVIVDLSFGSVLGKAPEYYDLALKGIADVTIANMPATPGRFPMAEVTTLPITFPSSTVGTKVLLQLWKTGAFSKDFADVKVLYVMTAPPQQVHWKKDDGSTLNSFKGKKIRSVGKESAILREIGAVPVSMAMLEIYEGLQKNVIDAAYIGWTAQKDLAFFEVTKAVLEIDFFMMPIVTVMNKGTWEKLPKDIQSIIDNISEKCALQAASAADSMVSEAKQVFQNAGGKVYKLSDADKAVLSKASEPLWQAWVNDMKKKGMPAEKTITDFRTIFKNAGVEVPFIGY
jgi:TRAP-type C4-dicarboxylate transport system substrate-binding protein